MIEIYGYGTNKNLLNEKEEIKCNNIIKQWKNENENETLMMLQKKR